MPHLSFSICRLLSLIILCSLSINAQNNWEVIDSAFGRYYNDLSCASSEDCILVGSLEDNPLIHNFRSIVHHTTDGGTSWRIILKDSLRLPPNQHLPLQYRLVAHPTPNLCIVATDSGAIMRSDNAGETWNRINIADPLRRFVEIDMPNANFGVMAQLPRDILLTTDQGLTWRKLMLPDTINNLVISDVASPKSGTIIAKYSDYPQIILTLFSDDSGHTWQVHPGTLDAGRCYFYNATMGWSCGIELDSANSTQGKDVIYRTINSGKTWEEQLRKRIQPN